MVMVVALTAANFDIINKKKTSNGKMTEVSSRKSMYYK
jgi:hypothetical protein